MNDRIYGILGKRFFNRRHIRRRLTMAGQAQTNTDITSTQSQSNIELGGNRICSKALPMGGRINPGQWGVH
jgi:hypothetical protein